MIMEITCQELADLASKLPLGDMRTWCELSAAGTPRQVVYADGGMLSRCRAAAVKPKQSGHEKESKHEDVQGQQKSELVVSPDDREDEGDSEADRD